MFLNDLRFAARGFLRQPGFSTAVLLTLALGIGANVAVFAVFEALMLRPMDYSAADELAILHHRDRSTGITKQFLVLGDYVDMTGRLRSFERLAAYFSGEETLVEPEGSQRVNVLLAGPGLLDVLRVHPFQGRAYTEEDGRPGAANVVMLGYEFWQRHYGGRDMIGRSIMVGNDPREVVAIAPPGFRFPANATSDLIVPVLVPATVPAVRRSGWIAAVGRLRPGVSLDAASAEISRVSAAMEQEFPATNHDTEYFLQSLRDTVAGPIKPALFMLLATVGVVLLIACANVANLLLVRSLGREREFAISQALGAGRRRLLSRMLAESLVLAMAAALIGVIGAVWGARALVALLPEADSLPALQAVGLNARVLAFAAGAAILAALISCGQSAWTLGSVNLAAELAGSRGASLGRGGRRASSTLIVAEVALAIVLLMGAGLLFRSFRQLLTVNPGFDRSGVALISVMLPSGRYGSPESRRAFQRDAAQALLRLPGVQAVGEALVVPLTGNNWSTPFQRVDQPLSPGEKAPDVGWQVASGGYFQALRIPLVAGRLFDDSDRPGGKAVVIVSEAIQHRYFGDSSAVGRMLKLDEDEAEIVGVVGNIRRASLRDEPHADMYFPVEQAPQLQYNLFVRTSRDPAALVGSIAATLRGLDAGVIADDARTMDDVARQDTQITFLLLRLLGLFAAIAMGLAAVGLYGVMAHTVRLRNRELGTRVALGATRRNIIGLVMRQGLSLAVVGVVIGAGLGLLAMRLLRSAVYEVGLADPISLAAATMLMLVTTAIACWLPARRAAGVDPALTLNTEA